MTKINEVIADPCTSYWLRSALKEALTRDPVDAAADADFLAAVLKERLDAIMVGVR